MKKYVSFLLVFLTIVCLPATAFMASLNYEGQPDVLNPDHIRGVFVWRDSDGFHLRATTTGDEHVFTGTMHTNGYFDNVNDRFFKGNDYYHLKDRDTIEFQLTTEGRTVGLDFSIGNGDYTAFELYMDGHKISPMDVYVGKDGWHPGDYKFTLDRPTSYSTYPTYYEGDRPVVIVNGGWGWGWRHHYYW